MFPSSSTCCYKSLITTISTLHSIPSSAMGRSPRALVTLAALAFIVIACQAGENGFVTTRGSRFVLNGTPFLFNGFNSYWLMHVAADPAERYKVVEVLREASAAGLTVCRTWAFSDGGDRALQVSPGVYDERVFQGLDFVISESRRFGIHLILTLVNNFNDFGGKRQYVQWAQSAGVAAGGEDDFYTNSVVKDYYKNHIKKVLTRYNSFTSMLYKDDPTIMAWELMNEPRCQADYGGKTVNNWTQEMASFTKSLDNKHMLEIGMEGFYGDSMPEKKQYNPGYQVGTDFITSNLIKEIDFATIHGYPDIWLSGQSEEAQTTFLQKWMWSHWDDAHKILKKPLVFSEFGKSKKDPGYTTEERDVYLSTLYRNIYDMAKDGGCFGGGLVWQIMAEGMENYYDGYEIVLSQNPTTSLVISRQSHVMTTLSHMLNGGAHGETGHVDAIANGEHHQLHHHHSPLGRKHGHHRHQHGKNNIHF